MHYHYDRFNGCAIYTEEVMVMKKFRVLQFLKVRREYEIEANDRETAIDYVVNSEPKWKKEEVYDWRYETENLTLPKRKSKDETL